jgi:hypothetical protein
MAIEKTHGWIASYVERAKALLTRPKEVWPEIHRDMTPSGELFTRYAAPLVALAPIVGLLTGRVWGAFSANFVGQLFTFVGTYAFSMINLLIMSFVASKLAPRYGGKGSPRDAFKLIVYSSTAAWLAFGAAMIPGFGFLWIASFYSLYLYFTGITPMMKVPEANKRRFGFVTIACAVALNAVTGIVSSSPSWMLGGGPHLPPRQSFRVNGDDVGFDGRRFADIGREIRESMRKGGMKTIPTANLEALLPTKLGSFERTAIESVTGGPGGGGHAQATYEDGGHEFTLKVVDLAGFGAMAQIGNSFRIEKNKQDEDGFEHVTNKDGTFVVEKWDNDDEEGSYTTIVDKRFLIKAEGEANNFDELKRAAASIDAAKLTALTK